MRLSVFLVPAFLALLLTACGGGDGAAPTQSASSPQTVGLSWVDVQDGAGNTVMQHRFAAGSSANEEVVTTTQYQGYDGVWGTADDWRTAEVRCQWTPGTTVSPIGFAPDSVLGVSPSICAARHELSGELLAEINGGQFSAEFLAHFRPDTASASDLETIRAQGWQSALNSGDLIAVLTAVYGAPVTANYQIHADSAGLRLCTSDCVVLGLASTLPISCGSQCGLALAPVADGLVINLNPNYCGASTVDSYDGVRALAMSAGGKLEKVIYSTALDSPFCYVDSYQQYRYDGDGQFLGSDNYAGIGADGIWLTADDDRNNYVRLQTIAGGRLELVYGGAGEDGVWETADDVLNSWQSFQIDVENRLRSAKKCTGAGVDGLWQTADDLCQNMIFHYTDEQ